MGLQANVPQPSEDGDGEDDIDAALTDLQMSLEGGVNLNGIDIVAMPTLADNLRYLRYELKLIVINIGTFDFQI